MHPVSCANTHHDITDSVNHGMIKNSKTQISWEQNITFQWNKKICNLCLRWHILRSYHFIAEVTINSGIFLSVCAVSLGLEASAKWLNWTPVWLFSFVNIKRNTIFYFFLSLFMVNLRFLCTSWFFIEKMTKIKFKIYLVEKVSFLWIILIFNVSSYFTTGFQY